MEFKPHAYQTYCIRRMIEAPALGAFLDMGLGKTVITLTALQVLKYDRWAVGKALVIAPKKVAEATWTGEAEKWDHLKRLRVVTVLGTAAERRKALDQLADVYVINRENTKWLVELYGNKWPFDCVVLDESSSFKNHRAERFRALKAVRPRIRRIIALTGTPRPRSLIDLWAQIYLLDGGQRLGRTISVYRDKYFNPGRRNRTTVFEWEPKEGAQEEIYRAISDICISMRAEDYLTLPDLLTDDIPVCLDREAQRAYDTLERDALLTVNADEVTATSAAALTIKLLQLCNGAVYDEKRQAVQVHDCKLEAFMETIEALQGQHAVVYYQFQHDRDRLLQALSRTALQVAVYRGPETADAWNAGKIDLLLAHPAACGYGLNLQGGGHHVIWFGLTWNLEEYQQANKRLHRQGQTCPVTVHRLIVKGGIDEDVTRALERKDLGQADLLKALQVRIERVKGEAK